MHGKQCVAVGLATPNHTVRAAIHACLTPASDYASQQHDERKDQSRLAACWLLDNTEHHHRLVAWAAPRSASQPVRLRFPPERTLQCAPSLHYAPCNAEAHRFSHSQHQQELATASRVCEHHQHTESRAHERIIARGDNELCSVQERPVHSDVPGSISLDGLWLTTDTFSRDLRHLRGALSALPS